MKLTTLISNYYILTVFVSADASVVQVVLCMLQVLYVKINTATKTTLKNFCVEATFKFDELYMPHLQPRGVGRGETLEGGGLSYYASK